MRLADFLRPDLIKMNMEARSREEAIAELLDVLVQAHEVSYARRDGVLEALLDRESILGTGMEYGVAIPHAMSELVDDTVAALGTVPAGIPFESLDGAPTRLVLLMVSPKNDFAGRVRINSYVGRLFSNPAVVETLVSQPDAQSLLDLMTCMETEFPPPETRQAPGQARSSDS
ncbi:MAG: PTS sugar transporter subunit IIA [Candidatus Hydrogenedentes bacterium]|nr:PTS sugar transporter subunit IIA [Candidatus Hydrogenedentota bacterium]